MATAMRIDHDRNRLSMHMSGQAGYFFFAPFQRCGYLWLGGLICALPIKPVYAVDGWAVAPKLTLTQSYSDNVTRNPASSAEDGWISEAAPGVRIAHSGTRLNLNIDYELHQFFYINRTQLNSTQNRLNSNARVEAIDDWLFIDALANVSQQNRSAFGASVADFFGASANRIETTTYQVAPNIRGRLSNLAIYQLRLNATQSHSADPALPDTDTTELAGQIRNNPSSGRIGWAVDGSSLVVRNDVVGKQENSRVRGSIIAEIDPQLRLTIMAGRELTDYATPTTTSTNTSGAGLEWSPTLRTKIAGVYERRFFGNGHLFLFNHRTPLTAWRISSSRDVTVFPGQLAGAQRGSIHDLLNDLLTSTIPDRVERNAAIERRLQVSGISASAPLGRGFLSGRPILNRNHEASFALLGAKNTATFTVFQNAQRKLGAIQDNRDSFALSNNIRQQGFNVNWSRKLSTVTSLALIASSLRSKALDSANLESKQYSWSLFLTSQLGPVTKASVGVRRVKFESSIEAGYAEHILFGSLEVRF